MLKDSFLFFFLSPDVEQILKSCNKNLHCMSQSFLHVRRKKDCQHFREDIQWRNNHRNRMGGISAGRTTESYKSSGWKGSTSLNLLATLFLMQSRQSAFITSREHWWYMLALLYIKICRFLKFVPYTNSVQFVSSRVLLHPRCKNSYLLLPEFRRFLTPHLSSFPRSLSMATLFYHILSILPKFGVICKLDSVILYSIIQIVNEDVKQCWHQDQPLRNATSKPASKPKTTDNCFLNLNVFLSYLLPNLYNDGISSAWLWPY